MTSSPRTPSDLFAAKGRAMPACSKPLTGRPAKSPPPVPEPTDTKGQDDGPASVLTIDLRRALVPARNEAPRSDPPKTDTSRTAAPARVAPRPAAASARRPPPATQGPGLAGPVIGTLVAVGIAAGVFYIVERDHLGATPEVDAPAVASVESAPVEDTVQAGGPPQETESGERDAAAAPEGGSLPSFDLVRVEPDGSAVIAGRAAPYADLILLHNGEPIGKVKADWAGEWAFVSDRPLPADQHQITILVNEPDAKITLPEGAAPPAQVSGAVNSQPR